MASQLLARRYALLALAAATPLVLAGLLVAVPEPRRALGEPAGALLARARRGCRRLALAYSSPSRPPPARRAPASSSSLAFVSTSGFLGLHALATPGVLLGKNAGFEAGDAGRPAARRALRRALVARARRPRSARRPPRQPDPRRRCSRHVLWALLSLAELPPLDDPLGASSWTAGRSGSALVGVGLYGLAAIATRGSTSAAARASPSRHGSPSPSSPRRWSSSPSRRTGGSSWWEWHVLMLAALGHRRARARARSGTRSASAPSTSTRRSPASARRASSSPTCGLHAFTERTGPRRWRRARNAYFERLVPLIEERGRRGAPARSATRSWSIFNKHGDQPEHAAARRAARRSRSRKRGDRGAADRPEWPRFRVGREQRRGRRRRRRRRAGHRKHGVVGDTVNLAARLQSEARVGCVVIGGRNGGCLRRAPWSSDCRRCA